MSPPAPAPSALAPVLAPMEDLWRNLLAAHVRAQDGGCAVCRSQVSGAQPWPCSLHIAAASARELARPGTGEPGSGC